MKKFCEKKLNIFLKKNEIFCEEYSPLKIAIGIGILFRPNVVFAY